MNVRQRFAVAAALLLVLSGCGEGTVGEDLSDAGPASMDAGQSATEDAGAALDSGLANHDAGELADDAGQPDDAGTESDAGTETDAGSEIDAGVVFKVPDGDLRRESLALGADPRVVFRYRSYDGARPAWVSPGTTTITHQLGAGIVATSRGELSSLYVTRFDGVDDGYLGDAAVATQSQGFTLEAWFRPEKLDGYRTLFSNTEGNRGFSLKIVDGKLRVLARVASGGSTVTYTLTDPSALTAGRWYVAAAQVAVVGSNVRLRLYRDHQLVAESSHPRLDGLAQSSSKPAVGAEPASSALQQDWYSGELFAVVLHDHPVDHDVLASPQLRDGSRYLGTPSYHDYLSSTDSAATRIARTDRAYPNLSKVRVRFGLPLLNDDWVPQGVAVSEDGRTAWLSGYSQDANGENPQGSASLVAEIDLENARLVKVYRLVDSAGTNLTLHVGGLGTFNGYLYVPSGSRVRRFRLADAVLEKAGTSGFQPPIYRLAQTDSFSTRSTGSFLDVDVERRSVWVGQFNDTGEARGAIDRYEFAPDGGLLRPSTTGSDERHVLPVDKVQGAVALPGEPLTFLLSTSYGNNASRLYRWRPGEQATLVATLPAGLEDLDRAPDGTVWSVFESGARYYQKRASSPWTDLTPYLIGLTP